MHSAAIVSFSSVIKVHLLFTDSVLGKYLDMYQTATDEVASYQLVDRHNRSHFPTIIGKW